MGVEVVRGSHLHPTGIQEVEVSGYFDTLYAHDAHEQVPAVHVRITGTDYLHMPSGLSKQQHESARFGFKS